MAVPVYEPDWITYLESQGSLEDYYVSIYDAELITDSYGDEAIRVYYAFSNHSAMYMSLDMALFSLAYQDGIELLPAYTEVTESDEAFYREIAPGDSATVSRVFLLRNPRSPVEAEVQSYYKYSALGDVYYIN